MTFGRYFALLSGIVLVVLGVLGFVPSIVSYPDLVPESIALYGIAGGVGHVFGLFPANPAENIFYIIWGAFGLAAAIAIDSSRFYAGLTAVIFGLITVLGLIPYTNTLFGLFPVYGNDVWLHGGLTVIAAYFGFIAQPNLAKLLKREAGESA